MKIYYLSSIDMSCTAIIKHDADCHNLKGVQILKNFINMLIHLNLPIQTESISKQLIETFSTVVSSRTQG